jgi:hypothetical protein
VVLTGTGFSGVIAMRVGGVGTPFVANSDVRLSFTSPSGLTVGPQSIDFDWASTFTAAGAFTDTGAVSGGVAFALIENTSNPTATVASLPSHVDCSWVFHWNNLQPTTGSSIDWSSVEACVAAATAAGKRSMIRINCGATSPSDIPTPCAITYTNASGVTQTQNLPKFWDSSYTGPLHTFIAALGAQYAGDSRILVVQMPGNGRIGELAMGTPNAGTPTWQSYGYTDALLISAWEATVTAYISAFSTGYLAWDMSAEPFHGANVLGSLITYAQAKPTRVVVQGNGLKSGAGIARVVTACVGSRPVGSQAYLPVARGGATVPQLLSTAAGVPLNYLEIYSQDCTSAVNGAIGSWAASAPGL